jgi:baculoviral IAP repeat-containing protein 6
MGIRCTYLPSQDRVIYVSDCAVGARRDLNGVLLLDSALQTTIIKPDDVVCIELPLPEVS